MSEELADVLLYALSLAEALQLDVATAVVDKLAMKAKKHPEIDDCGSASWVDQGG